MVHRVIYTRPYDARVEYLESSGTQYIDTGTMYDSDINIDCKFAYTTNKNNNIVFRYAGSKKCFGVIYEQNFGIYVQRINKSRYCTITFDTEFHTVKNFQTFLQIDDVRQDISSTFDETSTASIQLFCQYNARVFGYLKLAYFKIYKGNTLVRDFIPVRIGQIGYMYDKVSRKLFANRGTGNFVLGPDVANPVPNIRRVFRFDNKRFVIPCGLEEGVDYEFVNAFLLTDYNLIKIEPNYPVIFKVKPIEGIQNVVICEGQNTFFIQNYSNTYKRWQAWNYDTSVSYSIPINGINTFTLNANKFIINSSEYSYPSHWNFQVPLVFNTKRSNGTGSIVFYSIKSESMDLRPIRLLRNINGKHTFDRQPKTIGSLGLLDISNQILYFGSGENISVYND